MSFLYQTEMDDLIEKDLLRRLRVLEPLTSVTARYEGREIILFCTNDYLGLSRHPAVIEAAKKAADYAGTGAGAARLISGTQSIHQELEQTLAAWKGMESALVYSAGYLSNLGVLTALAGEQDLLILDKLCHASLIDAARLSGSDLRIFPHRQYDKAEKILQQAEGYRRKILVSDTVFSMDGDLADLKKLTHLKKQYDALLIVDDAHGTGILGETGSGAVELFQGEAEPDIITGTLSKALGSLGGYAAGSKGWIDYLVNFSRPFIFATALPPMICTAVLEAIRIIQVEPDIRQKLWGHVSCLSGHLKRDFDLKIMPESPILPLPIGPESEALRISDELLKRGFWVPAIRYPTVARGKARLRITLSAAHNASQVDSLARHLREILRF